MFNVINDALYLCALNWKIVKMKDENIQMLTYNLK